jgi:hypothetical protein
VENVWVAISAVTSGALVLGATTNVSFSKPARDYAAPANPVLSLQSSQKGTESGLSGIDN